MEKMDAEIWNVWLDICDETREKLAAGRHSWDRRSPYEKEFENILQIISGSFPLDSGSAPTDLSCSCVEDSCETNMFWNFPRFVETIRRQALRLNMKPEILIKRALLPLRNREMEGIRFRVLSGLLGGQFVRQNMKLNLPEERRRDARNKIREAESADSKKFAEAVGRKNV